MLATELEVIVYPDAGTDWQDRSSLITFVRQSRQENTGLPSAIRLPRYSGTIPIQNIVLPPTSTSYLRTKSSLPPSSMRNTARLAGTVRMAEPSRTGNAIICAATSIRPLGSI